MAHKICPRCGSSSEKKEFIESFCIDCFLKNLKLGVPERLEIPQCSSCGKVRLREWTNLDWLEIEHYVRDQLPKKFPFTLKMYDQDAFVVFETPVKIERKVHVAFKPDLCLYCSRRSGGYFEAVIQLRGPKDQIEYAEKGLRYLIEQDSFIPRRFVKKEGVDLQVGSKQIAQKAIATLGYKPTRSSSLYGVKAGKRIYRTTFCVRLGDKKR